MSTASAFPAQVEKAARRAELPNPLPLDYEPQNNDELLACLKDPLWRICSGQLYKITVKKDEGEGFVMPFRPNRAQRRFLAKLHTRNVILKARQLGFTTLMVILFLDHAIFNDNQRCGIIAHNLEDAGVIFRDKARFAYENLPDEVKALYPLKNANESELFFTNNSSIRVAVSMRSGTIHRLHISEMGKIAAKFPQKAHEIVTGSLPAVPETGIATIESTAEGQEGEFFEIADRAEKRSHNPAPLVAKEWRFHFYPWHDNPEYQTDPRGITISPERHEYFDAVEARMGVRIRLPQRAWYVATLEHEQNGDAEKMWKEYPSTPDECWKRSTEGTFYAPQIARARADGRITKVPHVSNVPVNTFWDIGAGDGTGIWTHQHVALRHRFLSYIEGWAEGYGHYINQLRSTGWLFGVHYVPHDATHERQTKNGTQSPLDMLQELAPDWRFEVVPARSASEPRHPDDPRQAAGGVV